MRLISPSEGNHEPRAVGRRLLTERPRPEWVRARPNAHWLIVGAVCIGAFMGQLDASIVSLAYPSLQRVFHTSLGAVTTVGLSYLIVLVIGVVAAGRLADMVGRKLLYVYGFAVFGTASALCAIAPDLAILDVARALQGIGAAMLQANSVAIISLAVPPEQLRRGIGIQGAAQALGLALGPAVGGLLLAAGGWRLIFLVNVPVAVVGLALAQLLLPRSRELAPREPFDWRGLGSFAPAVAATLLALSGVAGRVGDGALVIVAVISTMLFVRRERRCSAPLIDPVLIRSPGFRRGIVGGFLCYLVLFGTLFVLPFLLERVHGERPAGAGLLLTALPLAIGVAAPFAGRAARLLRDRAGALGMALVAGALATAAAFTPSGVNLVLLLVLAGIGFGLFVPTNNASIMASAPRRTAGVASGVVNMTRGTGTASGLALMGAVLAIAGGTGSSDARTAITSALAVLSGLAVLAALIGRPARDIDDGASAR